MTAAPQPTKYLQTHTESRIAQMAAIVSDILTRGPRMTVFIYYQAMGDFLVVLGLWFFGP